MEKKSIIYEENVEANSTGLHESFLVPKTEADSPNVLNTGLRYDAGKNRLDLLPPEWEWELGKVLTAGANKYADRNWELGMQWSKVVGPLRRHLNRFLRGEQLDEETGCHHLAHVAWNALALLSYDLRHLGEDNLNRRDYLEDRA